MALSFETGDSSGLRRTLVIMAKAPRPGEVKTRLAQDVPLSLSAAAELYRCLLEDTLALARSLSGVNVAILCPEPDQDELSRWLGNQDPIVAQSGSGLVAGLTFVFRHFAKQGTRVIAFNSDSPHLPASVLQNAFDTLAAHDLIIGPTDDGGYYLVGAKASHPGLFEGDGMGTRSALDRLLARARDLQLSYGFSETFYDIDVAADLARLARELQLAPERAPRTAAWLAERKAAVSLPSRRMEAV